MVFVCWGDYFDATIAFLSYISKSIKIKESIFQISEKNLFFEHLCTVKKVKIYEQWDEGC
jgi:hypothetical protein